jgi:hypothetical protein
MSDLLFAYAAGRGSNDQPLTKAARVALELDPTPRPIKMGVDQEGQIIEIPAVPVTSQPEE